MLTSSNNNPPAAEASANNGNAITSFDNNTNNNGSSLSGDIAATTTTTTLSQLQNDIISQSTQKKKKTTTSKKKKGRKKRRPGQPKGPRNACNFYVKENFAQAREEYYKEQQQESSSLSKLDTTTKADNNTGDIQMGDNDKHSNDTITTKGEDEDKKPTTNGERHRNFSIITKILYNRWSSLDQAAKEPYHQKAIQDKQRYKSEMKAFEERMALQDVHNIDVVDDKKIIHSLPISPKQASPYHSPINTMKKNDENLLPPISSAKKGGGRYNNNSSTATMSPQQPTSRPLAPPRPVVSVGYCNPTAASPPPPPPPQQQYLPLSWVVPNQTGNPNYNPSTSGGSGGGVGGGWQQQRHHPYHYTPSPPHSVVPFGHRHPAATTTPLSPLLPPLPQQHYLPSSWVVPNHLGNPNYIKSCGSGGSNGGGWQQQQRYHPYHCTQSPALTSISGDGGDVSSWRISAGNTAATTTASDKKSSSKACEHTIPAPVVSSSSSSAFVKVDDAAAEAGCSNKEAPTAAK